MDSNEYAAIPTLIEKLTALNTTASGRLFDDEPARKEALKTVRKLNVLLEKPQTVPLNAILPVRSTVARIAVDLDLFSHLGEGDNPKTINELATRTKCDPILMARILRILDSMGWAEQVDDVSFRPTAIGDIVKTRKPVEAGIKHLFDVALPIFAMLPEYFREHGYHSPHDESDGPFQHAFGVKQTAFDWWAQDPARSANFNTFMSGTGGGRKNHWTNWFPVETHLLQDACLSENDALLVDVGGGRGHDLDTFIKRFPDAKGRFILEDLPSVIDDYRHENPRIEPVGHSFFDVQPVKGAKMYFLHHVLHNWPDEGVVRILSNIREAMTPGYSRILIAESVLPDRDCPPWKAEMDWWMMAIHAGSQRTAGQFRTLCEKAGLQFLKYWGPPGDGDGIIEVGFLAN